MRRLRIGDRLLRIRDEGEGKLPPVCLLHGAGSSSVVWMDAVKRIAPRRRVIAPDLPGHGQSDRWHPPPEVSIPMYADAVGTMCAHLKIEKVVLVGHSMGALVALHAAAAWPERVAGLVLVGGGAKILVAPVVYERLKGDFSEWLQKTMWSPQTPVEIVERWNGISVTAEPEIVEADYRAIERFDGRPLLERIKTPTLIIGGADDLATPPKLSEKLAAIAGSRLCILLHAGHWTMLEQADAFHAALDPFLAALTG